ncbi:hypothetical protein F8155_04100 [Priestia endophytica]|nr:hypothetical protein F8155_04100 [Priestia endophytica]
MPSTGVKALNPHIEEEVVLEIEGVTFTGFAFVCPYIIEVGKTYPVLLSFTVLDELIINEVEKNIEELERVDTSYQYYIRGTIQGNVINAGLMFTDDEDYFYEYAHLQGKTVEIKADRISVEFLHDLI